MSKAQEAARKAAAEAEAVAAEAEARAQEETKKKGVVKGACCQRVLVQTVGLAPMFLHCDCCPRRAQREIEIAPQSGPVRRSACVLSMTSGHSCLLFGIGGHIGTLVVENSSVQAHQLIVEEPAMLVPTKHDASTQTSKTCGAA